MAIRWNKSGIPHTEWRYLYEFDLGDCIGNCAMCGTLIRYVHVVVHADYGELEVGRQCATKMTAGCKKGRVPLCAAAC